MGRKVWWLSLDVTQDAERNSDVTSSVFKKCGGGGPPHEACEDSETTLAASGVFRVVSRFRWLSNNA